MTSKNTQRQRRPVAADNRQTTTVDWAKFVGEGHERYEQRLIDEAINRLEHRDVSLTPWGIRVQVRPDLGDCRARAAGYWIGGPRRRRCLCHEKKTTGRCAHDLAAAMYRDWLDKDQAA
jgi:hypothetical protein